MNHIGRYSRGLVALTVWLIITMPSGPVRADESEFRNYINVDYTLLKADHNSWHLSLKPYYIIENRFRGGQLVYEQWTMGLKMSPLPWLSVQSYYTPREQMYAGKPRVNKDVAGSDLLINPSFGRFQLLSRQANEWRITERYYRYRNLIGITYKTPVKWLSLDADEEIRIDSDQPRINQNDLGGGLQFGLKKSMFIKLFYDLEAKRRHLPEWQYVRYLGLAIGAHL